MAFKQWGRATSRSGNNFIGTFPISFNTVYCGIGQSDAGGYTGILGLTTKNITINSQWNNNAFNNASKAYYVAIGK